MMICFLTFGLSLTSTCALIVPRLKSRGWSEGRIRRFLNNSINAMLFVIVIFQPPLTGQLVAMTLCRKIGPADGLQQEYLEADLHITCTSSHYRGACLTVASVFFVLISAGIPCILLYVVVRFVSPFADRRRERMGMSKVEIDREKKDWEERAPFFTKKYEPAYWYWEAIEMCRRLTFESFIPLIDPGTVVQAFVAMLLGLFFLLLHTRFVPYRLDSIDMLMFVSQLCILLLVLYAVADSSGIVDTLIPDRGGVTAVLVIIFAIPATMAIVIIVHVSGIIGTLHKKIRRLVRRVHRLWGTRVSLRT